MLYYISVRKYTLTQPTFLHSAIVLLKWTYTFITSFGIDTFSTRMTGVPPFDRLIVALVDIDTLRTLSTIVEGASVTWLATTVVPTGHIETSRRLMASMQITRTLVKI